MLSLLLAASLQQSPTPPKAHLLVDLNATPDAAEPKDSDPRVLCALGPDELWVAGEASNGVECHWRVDTETGRATALGTEVPEFAVRLESGRVVYGAREASGFAGLDLFALQPWPDAPVTLLEAPFGDAVVGPVVEWRGELWFVGFDAATGRELMRTDGTLSGTKAVTEFGPGSAGLIDGAVHLAGDRLFLSAAVDFGMPAELYVLDDPDGALQFLGAFEGDDGLVVTETIDFRGELWFAARSSETGAELWRSDGTPSGTGLVSDLVPGPLGSDPRFLGAGTDTLYLQAGQPPIGRELFAFDSEGVGGLVLDLIPGSSDGVPTVHAAVLGDELLFAASSSGNALYRSDGTAAGTVPLTDPLGQSNSEPRDLVALENLVYFSAKAPGGKRELYSTPGTTSSVRRLTFGGEQGFDPVPFATPQGLLFAGSSDSVGRELFRTEGAPNDATLVANLAVDALNAGSDPRDLVRFGARLAWSARGQDASPRQVWFSDGTVGEATALNVDWAGLATADVRPRLALGDRLLITVHPVSGPATLWASDGTTAGTEPLPLPGASADAAVISVAAFGNLPLALIEEARADGSRRLALTDGTVPGTTILYADDPDVAGFELDESVFLNGRLVFVGRTTSAGRELWFTDGTPSGTAILADLQPGPEGSDPTRLVALEDRVVALLQLSPNEQRLASTDGTPAGTVVFYDPNASPFDVGAISGLVSVGSEALFTRVSNDASAELFRTDGTFEGTGLASTLPIDLDDPGSGYATTLFGRVRDTAAFHVELAVPPTLIVSDGTPAGALSAPASAIGEYVPTASGELRGLGGTRDVLFPATASATGTEPWLFRIDGPSVEPIDVLPGAGSSDAAEFTALGGRLFFTADDGATGREIHFLDLAELDAYAAEPFGQACSNAPTPPAIDFDGDARLGASLIVELTDAEPGAPALLFRSLTQGFLEIDGCTLYATAPQLLATGGAGPTGALALTIPLPADPALAGLEVTLQYLVGETAGPIAGALASTGALEVVLAD